MGYKTLDGYELKEGEECFIALQCGQGTHNISPNPRPAYYMNEDAKRQGWDFCTKYFLRVSSLDCRDCTCEIIGVWKNNPGKARR